MEPKSAHAHRLEPEQPSQFVDFVADMAHGSVDYIRFSDWRTPPPSVWLNLLERPTSPSAGLKPRGADHRATVFSARHHHPETWKKDRR